MMGDVGALDLVIHLVEIRIRGMQAGKVVEHEILQLFFSTGRVEIDE